MDLAIIVFCIFVFLSTFIVLCLPLLCSVYLHCALSAIIVLCCHLHFLDAFLCDCTCCHAEDYKNWMYSILWLSVRFVPLYAEVDVCILLVLTPWHSSLRYVLTATAKATPCSLQ